ncbi:MAG: sigma-54-dependent Fis family transcriptional regulator [Sandaracinaceae bacterium]|nr:sigma-54-dependent Fis family transcriptional regulator [Sandaracinaceae bacterium]
MEGSRLLGAHPSMERLRSRIQTVARTRSTVLITGETGTGKELVAKLLHEQSPRANGPLVRVNCAAFAPTLLESELFGHEQGAFTGASARRAGRLEQANGGTLFLDEVGEVPLSIQVKLLRFLQERELERVGGNETLRLDVRVVAAANRDLGQLVAERAFREDLYYRLRVVELEVPPLRARPSDVPLLAEHFLRRYADENGVAIAGFTDAAERVMLAFSWPGNVRQLQHAIEQAVVFAESDRVDVADLPIELPRDPGVPLTAMIPGMTLAELERFAVLRTLESVEGSTSKAAAILGVSRRTIQYRLQEWGLSGYARPRGRPDDEGGDIVEVGDD